MAAYDEDSVLKRGRGRPLRDNARRKVRGVRFDEEEEVMLEHLEIEFGMSMSEIIRKAVRMYYNMMAKRL